jgi:hypothetical protein
MTIDSSWLCAFKEELPHAFTPSRPFAPAAVFVDGQIRLMQGHQSEPQTWDDFIQRQFARPLAKAYEQQQCAAVILAFDNYEHVPRAKCMTQAKRRRHVPVLPFSEASELPCMVPEGERWAQCIANRVFKTRVIDLVLLRLPAILLRGHPRRRLIVDYHAPVEYRLREDGRVGCSPLEGLPALGEADIKFTRFADHFGRLAVDSIDGDSVPIALMHHERCLRQARPPPLVSIYRMELKTRESGGKRGTDGEAKAGKKPARAYEHVNVHALYEGLKQAIAQSTGRIRSPTHGGHEMAMLVALIALTGTDFSRNLPQLSGRTLYGWLPDIWPALMAAYQPASGRLDDRRAADELVALLYRIKFQKHAGGATGDLPAVLGALQRSALSARVRDSLPSPARVVCTVRNANWVLAYWTCEPAPDPIQPEYGFRLLPSGCPEYDDNDANQQE